MKKRLDTIDSKMAILFEQLAYADYLKWIYSSEVVRLYDYVTGKVEIGLLPETWLKNLSNDFLDRVENEVDEKLQVNMFHKNFQKS